MPKKPTEPFGHIAFGKDGSVRKHMEQLPDNKDGQELDIGERFAMGLEKLGIGNYDVKPCDENDHDFWLVGNDSSIHVQATEIVSRDYLRELSEEDYANGNHPFKAIHTQHGKNYGVDAAAKESVLLERIKGKLDKHYAKQKAPLWLLVWSVCSGFHAFWVEGGQSCVSSGVEDARTCLTSVGPGPFDEIWFINAQTSPHRIWPI